MTKDGIPRHVWVSKGLFVVVGAGYAAAGPPLFGLDPLFVGSVLVAYGVVSFLGGRLLARFGLGGS